MGNFVLSAFADEIDANLKIQMDVLDEHSIKHIEMRGVNGKNITAYTVGEIKEIKNQLDERGFKLSAVGSPIGKIKITDDFALHLDLFKHTLEIARVMETKYIRIFSFFVPQNEDLSPYRDEVFARMQRFSEISQGSGITLLHENEKDIYGDNTERCVELLEAFPQIRATFDPANFVQCGINTLNAFEKLDKYVDYVHIKDARLCDGEVVPAGQGDGNVLEILKRLSVRNYEGFLSLEPHLGDFEGFADLEGGTVIKKEASGPDKFAVAVNALNKLLKGMN